MREWNVREVGRVLTFSMDKMNMRVVSSDGLSYLISGLNEYLSLIPNAIIVGGTYIYSTYVHKNEEI